VLLLDGVAVAVGSEDTLLCVALFESDCERREPFFLDAKKEGPVLANPCRCSAG
jgi:hypothetical protein